jgi:hypothetical protein
MAPKPDARVVISAAPVGVDTSSVVGNPTVGTPASLSSATVAGAGLGITP